MDTTPSLAAGQTAAVAPGATGGERPNCLPGCFGYGWHTAACPERVR